MRFLVSYDIIIIYLKFVSYLFLICFFISIFFCIFAPELIT